MRTRAAFCPKYPGQARGAPLAASEALRGRRRTRRRRKPTSGHRAPRPSPRLTGRQERRGKGSPEAPGGRPGLPPQGRKPRRAGAGANVLRAEGSPSAAGPARPAPLRPSSHRPGGAAPWPPPQAPAAGGGGRPLPSLLPRMRQQRFCSKTLGDFWSGVAIAARETGDAGAGRGGRRSQGRGGMTEEEKARPRSAAPGPSDTCSRHRLPSPTAPF